MADEEFQDRTILVTGGSRGIGQATCARLAETGARVAINFASNAAGAQATLDLVEAAGGAGAVFQADVSDLDQMTRMYRDIADRLGPVDMLVANAGIASANDKGDMGFDIWYDMMRVNLTGTFHSVWLAKDGMLERGFGRIVCLSSVIGLARNPIAGDRLIAYGASKAAIVGLTRNLAAAFGPTIRVNCVAPGFIDTEMTENASEEVLQRLRDVTPLGRTGRPEEIAETIYFLLSDRSSFTTGQTIAPSGGMVMMP